MTEVRRQGVVLCVSGPSGVGKGTVIRELRRMRQNIVHSISMTTREPRPGERDGVEYYFCSRAAFLEQLDRGEILEHDYYCENYYGTPRTPLEKHSALGYDVVMDITVPGSLAVMKNYPDAITLFLMPPSYTELRRRLTKRGTEAMKVVEKRMQKARDEIHMARLFQYVVVNEDITQSARDILAILDAEHSRYARMAGIEDIVLSR